jgi:hypothetical protein
MKVMEGEALRSVTLLFSNFFIRDISVYEYCIVCGGALICFYGCLVKTKLHFLLPMNELLSSFLVYFLVYKYRCVEKFFF